MVCVLHSPTQSSDAVNLLPTLFSLCYVAFTQPTHKRESHWHTTQQFQDETSLYLAGYSLGISFDLDSYLVPPFMVLWGRGWLARRLEFNEARKVPYWGYKYLTRISRRFSLVEGGLCTYVRLLLNNNKPGYTDRLPSTHLLYKGLCHQTS